MTDAQTPSLPPAARWAAVVVLGSLGSLAVLRGLTSPPPVGLSPSPSNTLAASDTPDTGSSDPAQPMAASPPNSPTRLINVNTATAAELDLLPGIGPALAGRIIDHRQANGPYRSLDDLDDVSGIGPKTIAKLIPYATAE